jgi:hypothetical protein
MTRVSFLGNPPQGFPGGYAKEQDQVKKRRICAAQAIGKVLWTLPMGFLWVKMQLMAAFFPPI